MSSMPPEYLRSELVTLHAAEMPTLRGFDEEFGQAAGVTQLDRTRSIFSLWRLVRLFSAGSPWSGSP